MNKLLTLILAGVLIVAGCVPATVEPTFTNDQLATRVNQILTTMPTRTVEPTLAPPTEEQPGTGGATVALADTVTVPLLDPSTAVPPTETLQPIVEPQPTATQGETLAVPSATTAADAMAATATAGTPQTPAPTEVLSESDPRRTLGNPTTTDDMSSASTWNWPLGSSEFSEMSFKDGKLLLTGLTSVSGWRLPTLKPASNVYIEMKARLLECKGSDNYGIIFNMPDDDPPAERGYLFSVSCDGKYKLWKWDGTLGEKGTAKKLIDWTSSTHINAGANVTNRLGVLVKGKQITLYVNGMLLEQTTQDLYPEGYFGAFITRQQTEDLTVEIDEMSFWDLD